MLCFQLPCYPRYDCHTGYSEIVDTAQPLKFVRPIAYVYRTLSHSPHIFMYFNPVASFTSTLFFQHSTWLDSSIIPFPVECREEGQSTGDSPSFCRLLWATFPCKQILTLTPNLTPVSSHSSFWAWEFKHMQRTPHLVLLCNCYDFLR